MIFLTIDFILEGYLNYSVCLRLEEKVSDLETEDQILRQQTLLKPPSRKMSGRIATQVGMLKDFYIVRFSEVLTDPFSFLYLQPLENGHHVSL